MTLQDDAAAVKSDKPGGSGGSAPPTAGRSGSRSVQTHRRHFVRDGEVQVVVRSPRTAPAGAVRPPETDALEADLTKERGARLQAEADLRAAQAMIQSLQTRLAHAELAYQEGLARLEARLAEREESPATPEPAPAADRKPPRRVAGKSDPKPVRWWTTAYRKRRK